jgi:molybdenum cofactor cytidylyltransferase
MALPWGDKTVLGAVLSALASGGVDDIRVVTGAARDLVEPICLAAGVVTVFNAAHERADMLSSIQTGLHTLTADTEAALIVLGDQPQIQATTIRGVVDEYRQSRARLVVPSYKMRRGHPWLVERSLWPDLLAMAADETAREFLNRFGGEIKYVQIDSESIYKDVDTPGDYARSRP